MLKPPHFIRGLRSLKASLPARCFAALLLLICFVQVLRVTWSRQELFRQFHLDSSSFGQWALQQPVPAMYNYANEVWYEPFPYEKDLMNLIEEGGMDDESMYFNHYPVRYLTFRDERNFFEHEGPVQTIYVRSTYRGQYRLTAYQFEKDEQGAAVLKIVEVRFGER